MRDHTCGSLRAIKRRGHSKRTSRREVGGASTAAKEPQSSRGRSRNEPQSTQRAQRTQRPDQNRTEQGASSSAFWSLWFCSASALCALGALGVLGGSLLVLVLPLPLLCVWLSATCR